MFPLFKCVMVDLIEYAFQWMFLINIEVLSSSFKILLILSPLTTNKYHAFIAFINIETMSLLLHSFIILQHELNIGTDH